MHTQGTDAGVLARDESSHFSRVSLGPDDITSSSDNDGDVTGDVHTRRQRRLPGSAAARPQPKKKFDRDAQLIRPSGVVASDVAAEASEEDGGLAHDAHARGPTASARSRRRVPRVHKALGFMADGDENAFSMLADLLDGGKLDEQLKLIDVGIRERIARAILRGTYARNTFCQHAASTHPPLTCSQMDLATSRADCAPARTTCIQPTLRKTMRRCGSR